MNKTKKFTKGCIQSYINGNFDDINDIADRQVGNTTIDILKTITKAIENPNIPIVFEDHTKNERITRNAFKRLIKYIELLELNNILIDEQNHSITRIGIVELSEFDIKMLNNSKELFKKLI